MNKSKVKVYRIARKYFDRTTSKNFVCFILIRFPDAPESYISLWAKRLFNKSAACYADHYTLAALISTGLINKNYNHFQ